MSQPSKALRQAVLKALTCAQSAASTYSKIVAMEDFAYETSIRNEFKRISESAYAASAHAWMAMIALASNQLGIAQGAAEAASNAEQVVSRGAFLLNLPDIESRPRHNHTGVLPDERGLTDMWQQLCASLPQDFPVPENLDYSLSSGTTQCTPKGTLS